MPNKLRNRRLGADPPKNESGEGLARTTSVEMGFADMGWTGFAHEPDTIIQVQVHAYDLDRTFTGVRGSTLRAISLFPNGPTYTVHRRRLRRSPPISMQWAGVDRWTLLSLSHLLEVVGLPSPKYFPDVFSANVLPSNAFPQSHWPHSNHASIFLVLTARRIFNSSNDYSTHVEIPHEPRRGDRCLARPRHRSAIQ